MTDEREWFVYTNVTYYPYAEIVKAATAEEAAKIANMDEAAVFPLDALAFADAGVVDEIKGASA